MNIKGIIERSSPQSGSYPPRSLCKLPKPQTGAVFRQLSRACSTIVKLGAMETKVISGVEFSSLPSSYIRPESDRPRLSEVSECNDVPVIDLGCKDRGLLVKQIGDACREYGFFQVF